MTTMPTDEQRADVRSFAKRVPELRDVILIGPVSPTLVIEIAQEICQLDAENVRLTNALREALDAWDGFMRRTNPHYDDPRDAHARELRKLVK